MGGANSEVLTAILQAKKDVASNKAKYKDLVETKNAVQQERNAYFQAIKVNQELKSKLKHKRRSSAVPAEQKGLLKSSSTRKSSQLGPSERFNTY